MYFLSRPFFTFIQVGSGHTVNLIKKSVTVSSKYVLSSYSLSRGHVPDSLDN